MSLGEKKATAYKHFLKNKKACNMSVIYATVFVQNYGSVMVGEDSCAPVVRVKAEINLTTHRHS